MTELPAGVTDGEERPPGVTEPASKNGRPDQGAAVSSEHER